jgi:hypothetical protein
METSFKLWLEKKEKKEGVGSKILAMALPMGSAIAGGAAGLATGGPLAALPAWIAAKALGTKASEKLFPKSTAELMKK